MDDPQDDYRVADVRIFVQGIGQYVRQTGRHLFVSPCTAARPSRRHFPQTPPGLADFRGTRERRFRIVISNVPDRAIQIVQCIG